MKFDIITGATGFVGKTLVLRWLALNKSKQLIVVGRSNPDSLNKIFEIQHKFRYIEFDFTKSPTSKFPPNIEIDTIYHCGGIADISSNEDDLIKTNVQGTINFLNWVASAAKINQVIFISSALACGYDTSPSGGFCQLDSKSLSTPNTPYGRSKYKTELKLKELSKKHDFRLIIVRPSYIFGPGMRPGSGFDKFINMVKNQSLGVRINYPGSLSYTFVDNFVSLLLHEPKNEQSYDEYFFADSTPVSYTDLFKMIGRVVGKEIKLIRLPEIFYKFIYNCLVYLYKIPYLKEKVPVHLLPLFKKNVGCIDFDKIRAQHKKFITVSIEHALKKTVFLLKKS